MYYLKLFDEDLISFDMYRDYELRIDKIKVLSQNKKIFPINLQKEVNSYEILNFINSRTIPKNRSFVNTILESAGLNLNDKKGIIDISKGLSLTDAYWIVQDNSLKFKDYNLFDNDFSEVLSLISFTGYGEKIKELITSPEFTTNGMLPKGWRRINNEIYLYKGGTDNTIASNAGYEPYSEYYASQIERTMNLDHVNYDLDKWNGILASTCKLFTSKDISFVPIYSIIKDFTLDSVYETIKKYHLENKFADMILLDALTLNPDRHFGNFGVLRNNHSGEIIDLAPLFDNGESLLALGDLDAFNDKQKFEKYINAPKNNYSFFGTSFDDLVVYFCNKDQIKKLNKLYNFNFEKHSKYNLSDNRLELLSMMIRERAIHLVNVIENSESIKNKTKMSKDENKEQSNSLSNEDEEEDER